MNKNIQGIIFDLGGVVVDSFEFPFYKDMAKKFSISPKMLAKTAERHWPTIEIGKETNVSLWKNVAKEFNLDATTGRLLARRWLEYYRSGAEIDKKVISVIKQLHGNYKLGVISNTQKEHTGFNKKRGLFNEFDVVILSNEVGYRKPQKEIFKIASKMMKIPFKHLMFIDDDIRWVRVARKYGLNAILFKSPKQLSTELKKWRGPSEINTPS